jgi:hypothetical protein
MKKKLFALAVFSLLSWRTTCSAQVADSATIVKSLIKCWRTVSKAYSTIYGLDEGEIETCSRQKLCFTRDSFTLYNGPLFDPKYSIRKVKADDFARNNFDCSKEKLGMLTDSLYAVTISSMTKSSQNKPAHKMTDVIAFDGYFIYVVNDGVIFKLYDSEAKSEGRSY